MTESNIKKQSLQLQWASFIVFLAVSIVIIYYILSYNNRLKEMYEGMSGDENNYFFRSRSRTFRPCAHGGDCNCWSTAGAGYIACGPGQKPAV